MSHIRRLGTTWLPDRQTDRQTYKFARVIPLAAAWLYACFSFGYRSSSVLETKSILASEPNIEIVTITHIFRLSLSLLYVSSLCFEIYAP